MQIREVSVSAIGNLLLRKFIFTGTTREMADLQASLWSEIRNLIKFYSKIFVNGISSDLAVSRSFFEPYQSAPFSLYLSPCIFGLRLLYLYVCYVSTLVVVGVCVGIRIGISDRVVKPCDYYSHTSPSYRYDDSTGAFSISFRTYSPVSLVYLLFL